MQGVISETKGDGAPRWSDASQVAAKEGKEGFWSRVEFALSAKGRNWTQAELARKAGVRPSSITHWKSGGGPSASELAKVANALGVSMEVLWGEEPMPDLASDAGKLSKPESDLVVLYRGNENFRRIVRNLIVQLDLKVEDS